MSEALDSMKKNAKGEEEEEEEEEVGERGVWRISSNQSFKAFSLHSTADSRSLTHSVTLCLKE